MQAFIVAIEFLAELMLNQCKILIKFFDSTAYLISVIMVLGINISLGLFLPEEMFSPNDTHMLMSFMMVYVALLRKGSIFMRG